VARSTKVLLYRQNVTQNDEDYMRQNAISTAEFFQDHPNITVEAAYVNQTNEVVNKC